MSGSNIRFFDTKILIHFNIRFFYFILVRFEVLFSSFYWKFIFQTFNLHCLPLSMNWLIFVDSLAQWPLVAFGDLSSFLRFFICFLTYCTNFFCNPLYLICNYIKQFKFLEFLEVYLKIYPIKFCLLPTVDVSILRFSIVNEKEAKYHIIL